MAEVSKTADQALAALELIGDRNAMSIAEVAREMSISRTVAYRLLTTLESRGYVRRSEGIYRLGPRLFALAQHVEWAVRDAAHPYMDELVGELQETVVLIVRDGLESLSVHRVVSRGHIVQVSYPPGLRQPLAGTIAGRVMLAFASSADQRRAIDGRDGGLQSELARMRRRGWGLGATEDEPGLVALAAPIRSAEGVSASLAVVAPSDRAAGLKGVTDRVVDAAAAISTELTR